MGAMSVGSEIPAPDWALWRAWVSMNQQLTRALDRQLQTEAGISQADYLVLLSLFESNDHRRRIGELAELIAWEKSRVSHQVARMEARGLVERTECDTDARGTWVGLTGDGQRTLLGAMHDHTAAILELFLADLTEDEKGAIHAVSRRVLDKLQPVACELSGETDLATTA